MPRFALLISYDGSSFNGWQSQTNRNGVQDHIQSALFKVAEESISVVCAGRTDAGVHATQQVVHFDTQVVRKETAWTRGLNTYLPKTISIQSVHEVSPSFHARFDARRRRYQYFMHRSKMRQPLLHQRAAWVFAPLDVQKMKDAAQLLVGKHDYSSFRSSQCQANSPMREIQSIQVHENGAMVSFEFVADGFLHHMIRNVMGCLYYVGSGRQEVAWLSTILVARDRRLAAPTFAPEGLYFTGVDYGEQSSLTALSWSPPSFLW